MKFERVHVGAFGGIRDLDTGPGGLPGLVVAFGPNEAGKSTLFTFLTTMLYGFYPASRERNPYSPWDGTPASGSATLRLDAGGCIEVERRLRSQPGGMIRFGGREEDARNRQLPGTEHVPIEVYKQVFAIGLSDLPSLEGDTWSALQERLIGTMGAADIRSGRAVADELEEEAGRLWRPSRRGNQIVRDIKRKEIGLRERRSAALESDRALRRAAEERDAVRARLVEAREERERLRLDLERVEELLPIRRQLRRIRELEDEAGDPTAWAAVPTDPHAALRHLVENVQEASRRLADAEDALASPRAVVADGHRDGDEPLLRHRGEILDLVTRSRAVLPDRTRVASLVRELDDLDRRLTTSSDGLLSAPWEDVPSGVLHSLPVAEFRERLRRLGQAREARRIAEAVKAKATPVVVQPARFPWAATLALALSVVVGAVAVTLRSNPLGWVSVLALATGAALLLRRAQDRPDGSSVPDSSASDLPNARAAEGALHREVVAMLRDLPITESLLEDPDEALAARLERLKELVRDRRDRERALDELRQRVAVVDRDARMLAARLGADPNMDAESVAQVLAADLADLEGRARAAEAAAQEVQRLERAVARSTDEKENAEGARDDLLGLLEALGDGEAQEGADVAIRRRRAAERATAIHDDLQRAHPDLDDLVQRIERVDSDGAEWSVDDEQRVRLRTRLEALTEEVERLASRAEALHRDVAHLGEGETVDAIDGAVEALNEQETRLLIERDRKWVLAKLIRAADRRFKEEHQPDVMRRAGNHLSHLTGGRYDRLLAPEDDATSFLVSGPGLAAPVRLTTPLSTGTLEQAYLALRLAIVDHLDQGQERLPLVLDETFVNWDRERRERGLDTIAAISQGRQVIVFTCHRNVADWLAQRGARLVEIGGKETLGR